MIVSLVGKRQGNWNLGLLEERLDIELNIREHILQKGHGQRMLKVFEGGAESFLPVGLVHIELEHRVFVVQQMIIDLRFLEQSHLGLPNLLGLVVIVHGLPLLPHNTKVLDKQIQTLCPIIVERLALENPELCLFGLLELQILLRNGIVGKPDLLKPSAQCYPFLIELNRLLLSAQAL